MSERVPPFGLTAAEQKKFAEFCKRYYASDSYKQSQQWLHDLVRKNTERLYNIQVPNPPKEK